MWDLKSSQYNTVRLNILNGCGQGSTVMVELPFDVKPNIRNRDRIIGCFCVVDLAFFGQVVFDVASFLSLTMLHILTRALSAIFVITVFAIPHRTAQFPPKVEWVRNIFICPCSNA